MQGLIEQMRQGTYAQQVAQGGSLVPSNAQLASQLPHRRARGQGTTYTALRHIKGKRPKRRTLQPLSTAASMLS